MILRKGAISARAGERMLIPINMRDGSLLATGRGNPEWTYTTCVCSDTLDESPMAYKPIDAIIKDIADTAQIADILKPVYNFKH